MASVQSTGAVARSRLPQSRRKVKGHIDGDQNQTPKPKIKTGVVYSNIRHCSKKVNEAFERAIYHLETEDNFHCFQTSKTVRSVRYHVWNRHASSLIDIIDSLIDNLSEIEMAKIRPCCVGVIKGCEGEMRNLRNALYNPKPLKA